MMPLAREERYLTGRDLVLDAARIPDEHLAAGGSLPAPVLSGLTPSGVLLNLVGTEGLEVLSGAQPVRRRRGRPWRYAGLVTLALALGLGLGWWLVSPRTVAVPAPTVVPEGRREAPPAIVAELFSQAEREKDLARRVQENLNQMSGPPGPDRVDRSQAMKSILDLGTLYLRERRLDEADAYFKKIVTPEKRLDVLRLVNVPNPASSFGQAMVLAYLDRAAQSNKAFTDALDAIDAAERQMADKAKIKLPDPKLDGKREKLLSAAMKDVHKWLHAWHDHAGWREQMSLALQRNYENAPKEFMADPRLEALRLPPRPGAKAAAP
jgi:hypothetical protein